jgi:hypothetical protein
VTFAVDLSLEILYDLLAIRFDSIITTQQTWHSCAIATLSCENASMHRDHPKLLWNISLAVHIITRLMMMAVGLLVVVIITPAPPTFSCFLNRWRWCN